MTDKRSHSAKKLLKQGLLRESTLLRQQNEQLQQQTQWLTSQVALLQQELAEVRREQADLEIMLETTTEHGDTIEDDLHQAEAKYRSIFENALGGIAQLLPDGRYLSANHALAQIYGFDSPQALIEGLTDPARQLYTDPQQLYEFLTLLQQEGLVNQFEAQVVRRDGTIIWIAQSARAVRDSDGTLLHYEAIIEDISERKNIDRLKNEFVSMVSHELRTPLTSIRGALGLVMGGVAGELPPQVKSLAEIAYRSSNRLVLLINDLLDIEKIEAGRMEFEIKPISLIALIEQSLEANLSYAQQFGITFKLDPDHPYPRVNADPNRLLQVLTNLLSNAAKFSREGDQVGVKVTQRAGVTRVAVIDHGPGIPEEFRSRIFQKFAQADSSATRKRGGTGLGLSICKAIIDKLGGQIGFESVMHEGTTFYFELPVCLNSD